MRLKPDPIRRHPPNVLPRSVRKEPRMAITAVPLHKNMKTYTMKQACKLTGMNYEALKFYCNSGLVPGLKRDQNNRRVFDERCIAWINDLTCLKRCGLGIKEMRHYTQLCLEGESSIPERQEILAEKREHLETQLEELRKAIAYIDEKQRFYADVTAAYPAATTYGSPKSPTESRLSRDADRLSTVVNMRGCLMAKSIKLR